MRRLVGLLAAAVIAAAAMLAGNAHATTGDTYVLPPSRYVLPPEVMSQFFGSYKLTSVGRGARLYAADMFITSNSYDDMYGGGEFYGYDSTGAQTSWTNILYDFRLLAPGGGALTLTPWTTAAQVANDDIVVTLYGWGSPSLGTMTLHMVTPHRVTPGKQPGGDLAGTISLLGQPASVPIRFHRIGPVT
ncbi:MAG: hypothetical protein JO345_19470 [Streptosporangiaceae bacterium]|nr:hypothetical protein [Streptosporangiaceae bacterium]